MVKIESAVIMYIMYAYSPLYGKGRSMRVRQKSPFGAILLYGKLHKRTTQTLSLREWKSHEKLQLLNFLMLFTHWVHQHAANTATQSSRHALSHPPAFNASRALLSLKQNKTNFENTFE